MPTLPNLVIPRSEAKARLQLHIEKSEQTKMTPSEDGQKKVGEKAGNVAPSFVRLERWQKRVKTDLSEMFTSSELLEEFEELTEGMFLNENEEDAYSRFNFHARILNKQVKWLQGLEKRLHIYKEPAQIARALIQDDLAIVQNICTRFHTVARQLRRRYSNRQTLNVKDEYDVQDLLHALLRLHFEDVRTEEYTPSYAGGSSRVDFLIKKEEIVIEVKKTRTTLKDKQIGEQLLIDINRYRGHPNCKFLFCFVYDPDGYINNPAGLEADLNRTHDGLAVRVFIAPKSH